MSVEERNQQQNRPAGSGAYSQRPLTAEEQNQQQWQGAGGGQWINPQVVRLSDEDVERVAHAVVRLLKEAP